MIWLVWVMFLFIVLIIVICLLVLLLACMKMNVFDKSLFWMSRQCFILLYFIISVFCNFFITSMFSVFLSPSVFILSLTLFLFIYLFISLFHFVSLSVTLWYYSIWYDFLYTLILYMMIWDCAWEFHITECAFDNNIWYSIFFNYNIFIRIIAQPSCWLPIMVKLTLWYYSLQLVQTSKRRIV